MPIADYCTMDKSLLYNGQNNVVVILLCLSDNVYPHIASIVYVFGEEVLTYAYMRVNVCLNEELFSKT